VRRVCVFFVRQYGFPATVLCWCSSTHVCSLTASRSWETEVTADTEPGVVLALCSRAVVEVRTCGRPACAACVSIDSTPPRVTILWVVWLLLLLLRRFSIRRLRWTSRSRRPNSSRSPPQRSWQLSKVCVKGVCDVAGVVRQHKLGCADAPAHLFPGLVTPTNRPHVLRLLGTCFGAQWGVGGGHYATMGVVCHVCWLFLLSVTSAETDWSRLHGVCYQLSSCQSCSCANCFA